MGRAVLRPRLPEEIYPSRSVAQQSPPLTPWMVHRLPGASGPCADRRRAPQRPIARTSKRSPLDRAQRLRCRRIHVGAVTKYSARVAFAAYADTHSLGGFDSRAVRREAP